MSSSFAAASRRALPWLLVLAACALTTVLTLPLRPYGLDAVNTVMFYLLVVVLIATRLGRGPAVLAAFLNVALFDFFHVPPHLSFAVSDAQYLLTFAVMLGVALWIAHLTTRLKSQAQEAQHLAGQAASLAELARKLAAAPEPGQVDEAVRGFLSRFQAESVLLLPDPQEVLRVLGDTAWTPSSTEWLAAKALMHAPFEHAAPVHLPDEEGEPWLWPLRGGTRLRGVLMVGHWPACANQRSQMDAVASLIATTLERQHFVSVAHQGQLEIVSERLRSSILSALSHDIRTPLTVLYGQADALLLGGEGRQGAHDTEKVRAIRDQAHRIHDMVSKLLDMARLQADQAAGRLVLRREWQPLEEVVGASLQALSGALTRHTVHVKLAPGLPLLCFDAVLIERVLANLVENASKYSPAASVIMIEACVQNNTCEVKVRNEGAGFPSDRLDDVFNVFERGQAESSVPGVGLGLSISRAIVEAHGGRIHAENQFSEGRVVGAAVVFTLPLGSPPAIEPEAWVEAQA